MVLLSIYLKVITVAVTLEMGPTLEYGGMKTMRFKELTPEEEQDFRQHAQENDPDKLEDWGIYHPVCREEWIKRGFQHEPCEYTIQNDGATMGRYGRI